MAAYACGSWTFQDLSSKKTLSFLSKKIELKDSARVNPRFMTAHSNRAFFKNGDRIKYNAKNEIELLSFRGLKESGRREFKKEVIGKYSKLVAELKSSEKLRVLVEKSPKGPIVSAYLKNKLIGKGIYKEGCFKNSSASKEARRVLSYYIWKTRRIDPYVPAVTNWWW